LEAGARRSLRLAARTAPRRRVLVAGVHRPRHAAVAAAAVRELSRSRVHHVGWATGPGTPGEGRWSNLNALIGSHAANADWLLLVDDDVVLPRGFLDSFLLVCEALELSLAQPAHCFASHAAWPVTRRRPGALARETAFVEIGPVCALRADTFGALLPFPALRMGWGLDAHWAALARAAGWRIGVVDALPMRHLRPVAGDYPREQAVGEARGFLAERPYLPRHELARTLRIHRELP